jgi:hypothetical protein
MVVRRLWQRGRGMAERGQRYPVPRGAVIGFRQFGHQRGDNQQQAGNYHAQRRTHA